MTKDGTDAASRLPVGVKELLQCNCGAIPKIETARVWTPPEGNGVRALVECPKCGLLSYHILKTKQAAIKRAVKGWNEWVRRRGPVQVAQRAGSAATVTPAFTPALAPEKEDR